MKLVKVFLGLSLISIVVTGCSKDTFYQSDVSRSDASVELTNVKVEITTGIDTIPVTEGENAGLEMTPTVLMYTFEVKNNGNTQLDKLDGMGDGKLKIKIQPSDELVAASKESLGFNIFNGKDYIDKGIGYSEGFSAGDDIDKDATYTFGYDLGVKERNQTESFIVPEQKKLDHLYEKALDAELLFFINNDEIVRLDLSKMKK